jgi:acetylornithine deacetylase/succinyl-diaminopimelate desuccinylase-like protein
MAANSAPGTVQVGEVAESHGVRDCLQWFTREKKWINETHLQLCRVPAPTFLEQQRAEWMRARFREIGCEASVDRAGNVVASLNPGAEPPYVALTAHLDTVLAPRNKDEITVETDGRFRGPGVADNGAGLAALLAIARAFKSCPPTDGLRFELLFVANVGEEGEGNLNGMRYLCQQGPLAGKFAAFLVQDGANTDHITARALGSRRFEVTFTGPGGHSWSDFGTGNPVHALSRAVAQFADSRPEGTAKYSFNVGMIEGGASINAIPALARAKVDIRAESNEKLDELVELLNAAIARAQEVENQRSIAGKVAARIKEIGARPAAVLADGASILSYVRAVDAHLGIRSRLDCSSTDANIPLFLAIPAVSIGAGGIGGGAHTLQEWFRPEGRDLGLKRIVLVLMLLLRDGNLAPAGDRK